LDSLEQSSRVTESMNYYTVGSLFNYLVTNQLVVIPFVGLVFWATGSRVAGFPETLEVGNI